MATTANPPVEILNPSDSVPVGSATRDSTNVILTRNALPALETRLARFSVKGERVATITDRSLNPLVRFSVEELIGFLEDAAIQVVTRVESLYLEELRLEKSPSSSVWNFTDSIRLLGGTVSIDGTNRAQRVSEEYKEDIVARGATLSNTSPIYTLENSELHVYGNLLDNPITSRVTAIKLPDYSVKTATGTYTTTGDVFLRTAGDTLDVNLHTLVNASITDNAGSQIRGILTDINEGSQNVRLDINDEGFSNSGTITMVWKTPLYSMLNEMLEEPVVELASSFMFAALGEFTAMQESIQAFEKQMEIYGLKFFKI